MSSITQKVCGVAGCDRKHYAKGLCGLHYQRMLTHGRSDYEPYPIKICPIKGCERRVRDKGLCHYHGYRMQAYGDPLAGKYERHGMVETSEYHSWSDAKQRCTNPNNSAWSDYGGRGIRMCKALMKFSNFIALMGEKHGNKTTIDRKDVNGNYSCGRCQECLANKWPMNLRWADYIEQADNKTNNHYITINGVTKTVKQWSQENGFNRSVIQNRLKLGWANEDLLRPVRKHKPYKQ